MAVPNLRGDEKYWVDGVPFRGLRDSNNPNTLKFWQNGEPLDFIQPNITKQYSFFMVFE
jgi:hypothetical protein